MLKLICLFSVTVWLSYSANAQWMLGAAGGATDNFLHTNINNRASTRLNSGIGFFAGIPVQYTLTHWLAIQADPSVIQKNYTLDRTDSLSGAYTTYKNTYLQLPLSLHISYGKKKIKVFATAGAYIAYWLQAHLKGKAPDIFSVTNTSNQSEVFQLSPFNNQYVFDTERDNRFEWGWQAGIGVQYRYTNNRLLFITATAYQSLTDQQKAYMINQVPQYNYTCLLSAGWLYAFK